VAFLEEAGFKPTALDLSRQTLTDDALRQADWIGIATPMHTALRLGVQVAQRIRASAPRTHLCFFGLYAQLNADYLLAGLADSVIAGEYETALVGLAYALRQGTPLTAVPGVRVAAQPAAPVLERLTFPPPQRNRLPPLDQYARLEHHGQTHLAGYVEASRGCLHTCRHCPIVPIYQGRFFVIPTEIVLADLRQQVAQGATHITFGDPDFLNGPRHALTLARALHAEFPHVTFDFTTKVEHILQHQALFAEFAALGCLFVTSAIESLSDSVLQKLYKGHTAADIEQALAILERAGIALRPTLVAFTPWTTLEDYLAQIEFIHTRGLYEHVPPIQLAIRLLVPPGSALLASDDQTWLGELDPAEFTYRWAHPDPRMDELYKQMVALVEQAESAEQPAVQTHRAIRELAYTLSGHTAPPLPAFVPHSSPPRLTENWFC